MWILAMLLLLSSVVALELKDDFECNGFGCGTGWKGGWATSGDCIVTTLSNPLDAYHLRGENGCDATRYFDASHSSWVNISFYATATSLENGDYCRYYYYDGTSNHELLALTDGDDDGNHDYYEFDVSSYGVSDNSGIRVYGGVANADYCYIDNVTAKMDDEPTVIDYVKEVGYTHTVGKITNMTNMAVFGTEYATGDNGTIFVQLLDSNSNPIIDASCEITVYDTNKTIWHNRAPATYLNGSNGMYYSDIFLPETAGVYIIDAFCYYSDVRYEFTRPFKVNFDGNLESGYNNKPENLFAMDCNKIHTDGGYYFEIWFNDTEMANINLSTITSVHYYTKLGHEKDNRWQIWNFTSSSWDEVWYDTYGVPVTAECYFIHTDSFTLTEGLEDYIVNGETRWRTYGDDTGKIYVDDVGLVFHNNGSIVTDIRGGGEIHLSSHLTDIKKILANLSIDVLTEMLGNLSAQLDNLTVDVDLGNITIQITQNISADITIQLENLTQEIKDLVGYSISVWGTEYAPQENGTVFMQMLDEYDSPVNDGYCEVDIYYPDKTNWYDNYPATYLNGSNGLYYIDLTVPNETGVHIIDAYCYYAGVHHKFELPENVTYDGNLIAGYDDDPESVRLTDCAFIKTESGYYQTFWFNDSGIGNINVSQIEELDLIWTGQHEETATYQAWNFSDSSWVAIGETNDETNLQECYSTVAKTRTITEGISDFVNGDEVRFRILLGDSKKIFTDEATLVFHTTGAVVSEVRGGGEIHIQQGIADALGFLSQILNYLQNTIYPYLQQLFNQMLSIESGVNQTIEITNQTLEFATEINDTSHLIKNDTEEILNRIDDLESNFTADFEATNQLIQDTHNNLTDDISDLRDNTTDNFDYTWWLINQIEQNRSLDQSSIMNYLQQIDSNINSTQQLVQNINQSITNNINLVNDGLSQQIGDVQNETTNVLNLVNNLNSTNYQQYLDLSSYINDLSVQIDTNNNLTQANITELKDLIANLNTSVSIDIDALNSSVYQFIQDANEELRDIILRWNVNVFGTDYTVGDNGRIFVQLVQNNTGFDGAVCLVNVHYPDSSYLTPNYFIEGGLLVSLGEDGLYYTDFTAPSQIGIYMISAECFVGENTTRWNATSDTLVEGTIKSGSIADVHEDDGSYYELEEQDNGGNNQSYQHEFEFNVSGLTEALNETATIGLLFAGRLRIGDLGDIDDTIKFQLWNYTSSSWIDLPNQLYPQVTDTDVIVANTGDGSGAPDYINNSILRTRMQDTDQTTDDDKGLIFIDRYWLALTFPVVEPVLGIAGGGELNVRAPINLSSILGNFTDLTNLLLAVNQSLSAEISAVNTSIYNRIDLMESNIDAEFNLTYWWLEHLDNNINGTRDQLQSGLDNLSLQVNETKWQIHDHIDALNVSIQSELTLLKNDTETIIAELGNFSVEVDVNFTEVLDAIDDLSVQVDNNFNITQQNITDIQTDISDLETYVDTRFDEINTTITQSEQNVINIVVSINQTITDTLALINNSLYNELVYTQTLITLVNQSLSTQLTSMESTIQSNFTSVFNQLGTLQTEHDTTQEQLLNLSLQLNETKWQLHAHIDALNFSTQERFDISEANQQTIIDLIGNLSLELDGNFSDIISLINQLSNQVDNNFDITQQNVTDLTDLIISVNTTTYNNYLDLNSTMWTIEQNIRTDIAFVNNTLYNEIIYTQTMLGLVNQSLSDQMTSYHDTIQSNFTSVFNYFDEIQANFTAVVDWMEVIQLNFTSVWDYFNQVQIEQDYTQEQMVNLSIQMNETKWQLHAHLDALNVSVNERFDLVDADQDYIIDLINNLSFELDANFTDVTNLINQLSTQEEYHFNISQQNITDLRALIVSVNGSLYNAYLDLNQSIWIAEQNVLTEIQNLNTSIITEVQFNRDLILALNLSMHQLIDALTIQMDTSFNTTYQRMDELDQNINGTRVELLDSMDNLSLQLNETKWQLHTHIDALNISMQERFEVSEENQETIISLIENVSQEINFTPVLEAIDDLSVQVDNNFDITQQNITDIRTDIDELNQSVYTFYQDLNSSLYLVEQNLITEIDENEQLILAINQTLFYEISYTQTLLGLINQSLSDQMTSYYNTIQTNFTSVFGWFDTMQQEHDYTQEQLVNLSLQLNETKWQLHAHLDAINESLWSKIDIAESKTDYAIELIQNLSFEFNLTDSNILAYLQSMNTNITNEFGDIDNEFDYTNELVTNLSVQVDDGFDTIQQNFTHIHEHLLGLNESMQDGFDELNISVSNFETKFDNYVVWLNGTLIEMKWEISNIENMTLIINQSVLWLVQWHNISTEDLSLSVEAPSRCLEGTNWIVWAEVRDRFGVILSPLDDVQCDMTTDLWGTESMGYRYTQMKWRYWHTCDPAYTIFNWTVSCERI